jgi:hypothetical protein
MDWRCPKYNSTNLMEGVSSWSSSANREAGGLVGGTSCRTTPKCYEKRIDGGMLPAILLRLSWRD